MMIEGGIKNALIRSEREGDIYVRSAFVLNSPHSNWESENRFIKTLQPVEAVQAMVDSVRYPNDVSVHVRMEGGQKYQYLPYESADNWIPKDHELIEHWRSQNHFLYFKKRLDELIAQGKADRVFLAADNPET